MTLPLTTTTVTIEFLPEDADPYEDQVWTVSASGVPAVISGSSGSGIDVGGAQETLSATLFTDEAVEMRKAARITDETTSEQWRVLWTRKRYELGLGHIVSGLEMVRGAADGP